MSENKQLYEKQSNQYNPFFPIVRLEDIIETISDKSIQWILNNYNHIYVEYSESVAITRNKVPSLLRRNGLWISYNTGKDIITEWYKGKNVNINDYNQWTDDANWAKFEPLADGKVTYQHLSHALKQLIGKGNVITNFPDEEDITTNGTVLFFKDRAYDTNSFSGLGRVILRKNIILDDGVYKNVLTQDMINKSNTIYEIRYDFDLNGAEITIPEGCVLDFQGGSFKNGTTKGNFNLKDINIAYNIFNDVVIIESSLPYFNPIWFGAIPDYNLQTESGTDSSIAIERAIYQCSYNNGSYVKITGRLFIANTIIITTNIDVKFIGDYLPDALFTHELTDRTPYNVTSGLYIKDGITAIKISNYCSKLYIKNLHIKGGTKGTAVFLDFNCVGAPPRVGEIADCFIELLDKFLYFNITAEDESYTIYGNLTIQRVIGIYCGKFIECISNENKATLTNLVIRDSNIEGCGQYCIDLENLFGDNIIENCIIENQPTPIRASITVGSLTIICNYFEDIKNNTPIIELSGSGINSSFISYYNNYINNIDIDKPIKIKNCTIHSFNHRFMDSVYIENCKVKIDEFINVPIQNIKNINFNTPLNYNSGIAKDDIVYVELHDKKIINDYIGKTISSDNIKLCDKQKTLKSGDIIFAIFYSNGTGGMSLYNQNGAGCTNEGQSNFSEGYNILKYEINKDISGIQVYAKGLYGDIDISQIILFINPNKKLYSYGVVPPNTTLLNYFGSSVPNSFGLLDTYMGYNLTYGDGIFVRNSDGSLKSKSVDVVNYNRYVFLQTPNQYNIVGDIDMMGETLNAVSESILDFSKGGTITNGILNLNNTLIYPLGINLKKYITADITGTFAEGQVIYDSDIKRQKLWNGSNWVNIDGSPL